MKEILTILKEEIRDYEAAARSAQKYLKENESEIRKRERYAKMLDCPVQEKQIFFCLDNSQKGDFPEQLLHYLLHTEGDSYRYFCCCDKEKKLPEGVIRVKEKSREFWEALATSRYIISSVFLPLTYVKREGQVYLQTMQSAYGQMEEIEALETLAREMWKADYILAPTEIRARELWLRKTHLGNFFCGNILVCPQPGQNLDALAGILLHQKRAEDFASSPEGGLLCLPGPFSQKKKILVLTSWKDSEEHKYQTRLVLKRLAELDYDTVVLSGQTKEPEIVQDFLTLPQPLAKAMYRGRMVVDEGESNAFRILEKHPDVYVKNKEVREYMNRLFEREWRRIWGWQHFDACLVLGSQGYQQYYMVMAADAEKKILIDLDFMPVIREKAPEVWRRALSLFDEIYTPAVLWKPAAYGVENQGNTRPLPYFAPERAKKAAAVTLGQEKYLVCEEQGQGDAGLKVKLARLPEERSLLVNAELPLTQERKALLETLHGRPVCFVGDCAASFQRYFGGGCCLEAYVKNILPLLPAAWDFFARFEGYYGDPALETDPFEEICRSLGVPVLRREEPA